MKKINFNKNWLVSEKKGSFGMQSNVDTIVVDLPYDVMIHNKRNENALGSYMAGFFAKGVWEYKKFFFHYFS